jgi:hypothetical protein
LLTKTYPKVAVLSERFQSEIHVTNLTSLNLQNVRIAEIIPDDFTLEKAEPEYTNKTDQKATWNLGTLKPHQTKIIKVSGKTASKEALPCCTSATYDAPSLCSTTLIVQPDISLRQPLKMGC